MLSKKDISILEEKFVTKNDLKEALKLYATKQNLRDEMRDMRDFVRQENQRMKTEIIREIADVVTIVMNRIENHEARLVALEVH